MWVINNANNIDYRSPALHRRLDVTSSPPSQANVTPSQGHRVSPQGHVTSPRAGNVVSPSGTSSSGRVSQSQQNVQRTSTMQPYSNSHTQQPPYQQTVTSPPGALTSNPRHHGASMMTQEHAAKVSPDTSGFSSTSQQAKHPPYTPPQAGASPSARCRTPTSSL